MVYKVVSRVTHRGPGTVHVKTYVKLNSPQTVEDVQRQNKKTIEEVEKKRRQEEDTEDA